ncbi:maltose ABC transporter substrate-binding protein [Clostridium sp.]|uniref:sugar ABC transporter substrate-binding protein n=1 Tax=Clostridium sp. TaxID=1506 RepID=UPI00263357A7|nr:maltose ABC transporter substrate-binding protein [Clostridium sp.]
MKFKKIINLLLITSMTMGVFSGCGKKEIPLEENNTEVKEEVGALVPEEGAKLTFWTLSGDSEYGKAVAQAFEEKYGIKVDVQENGMESVSKMMLDGPSGNGADIFMGPHDAFLVSKDAGIIAELSEEGSKTVKNEIDEVAVNTVSLDGKVYGVPVSIENYALLYNKDLVTGEPASTMEQIKEEAGAYNDPSQNKFWYITVPTDGYPAFTFLSSYGFELFGPIGTDGDNPGFDTPEFVKGLEAISKLKDIIPIKAEDLKMETMSLLEQNFKEGKTAYYPIGPWLVKSLKEENINFGVTPLPTMDGKQLRSFSGVQNAYVSAYSEYPKAAELFALFLTSDEAANFLYEKSYRITAKKDITNVTGLMADEELRVFSEAFKTSVPMPSTKRLSYYWTVMQGVLNSVFEGTLTPEEGAAKAQADFDALVQSE